MSPAQTVARKGVIYAVLAHFVWGAMASYLGLLTHVPAIEVAAHRGFWSVPIAFIMILITGGMPEVRHVLKSPRILLTLTLTSFLIAFNWSIYVWSIEQHRTLESALGYFINPLLNVVVGYLFLKERFTRAQLVAIGLAVVAVGVQTYAVGSFPWLGLSLAVTFCAYGFIRKQVAVSAVPGFFTEVLVISVPAGAFILWGIETGKGAFLSNVSDTALLFGLGAFTATPLLLYAASVRRLRYSTAGILQYLSPSLVFLTAVFIFHEPMSALRLFSFSLLWLALGIYTVSALREDKARRLAEPQDITSSGAQA